MATIARLAQKLEADCAWTRGLGDSMAKIADSAARLTSVIDRMDGLSREFGSELTREEVNKVAADACEIIHELRPTLIVPLKNEDSTDVLCRMLEVERQELQELHAVVADLKRRLAAFEAVSRAGVKTESDAGREGTETSQREATPDPKAVTGLNDIPLLDKKSGNWITAVALARKLVGDNAPVEQAKKRLGALKTARTRGPHDAQKGRDSKGYVWRADPDDRRAIWYLKSSVAKDFVSEPRR